MVRYLVGIICVLALSIMGCSETAGTGGSGGDGGVGGVGGVGGGTEAYAWCEVYPPSFTESFTAASSPEPLSGTVVGSIYLVVGGIYGTTDGGVTWTTQESPVVSSYSDLIFTDVNTGTIVGDEGTILRTTDGGDNWIPQGSGTEAALYGVSFADANTGLVVGSGGTILSTTNGGATWVSQESGTDSALRGAWLSDANTATAVGAAGTILRTIDGGATWVPQDSGTELTLNAVSFASATTGVAVSGEGVILRTTDGGATWAQFDEYSSIPLNDVWFTDANVGTIVGASGTILRTTDGGTTWAYELSDAATWYRETSDSDWVRVGKTFYGVSMSDPKNGVAAGDSASVARRMTVPDTYGVCDPWCAKNEECYPEYVAGCDIDCLCNLRYHHNISPECERAVVDSQICFSALTCEQFEAYFDDPYNHPCTEAERQIDIACNPAGAGGTAGSGGSGGTAGGGGGGGGGAGGTGGTGGMEACGDPNGGPLFEFSRSEFRPFNSLLEPDPDCTDPSLSGNPGANLTGIDDKCLIVEPPNVSGCLQFEETSPGNFDATGEQTLSFVIDVIIASVAARVEITTNSVTSFAGTSTGALPGTITMDDLGDGFNINAAATGTVNCKATNTTTNADVSDQICPLANFAPGDNTVPLPGDPGKRAFPTIEVGADSFELGAGPGNASGWYLVNPAPLASNGTQWAALSGDRTN